MRIKSSLVDKFSVRINDDAEVARFLGHPVEPTSAVV